MFAKFSIILTLNDHWLCWSDCVYMYAMVCVSVVGSQAVVINVIVSRLRNMFSIQTLKFMCGSLPNHHVNKRGQHDQHACHARSCWIMVDEANLATHKCTSKECHPMTSLLWLEDNLLNIVKHTHDLSMLCFVFHNHCCRVSTHATMASQSNTSHSRCVGNF